MTLIRNALVLVAEGDERHIVAGLPHLTRTVLTLQRAGIERVVLAGAATVPVDGRITCDLRAASFDHVPEDGERWLLVGSGTVVDVPLVRSVIAAAATSAAVRVQERGAVVRVASPRTWTENGTTIAVPVGTIRPLTDAIADVEMALLGAVEDRRDGFLDSYVNRRLSRPLSRRLVHAGVAPNLVTMIGVALGVGGGIAIGSTSGVLIAFGVVALVLSGVSDCCDGAIARVGFSESKLGHVLDVMGDTIVHLAVLAGISWRLVADGSLPPVWTIALLGVGVLGSFAAITWSEVNEARRRATPGWENRVLDRVLSPLTTRDWYVFPVLFALAGRLDLLIEAAAIGANLFWPIVLVLVRRALGRASAAEQHA